MIYILRKNYTIGDVIEFTDGKNYEKVNNTGRIWEDWKQTSKENFLEAQSNNQTVSHIQNHNSITQNSIFQTSKGKAKVEALSKNGKYAKVSINGKFFKINLHKLKNV